MYEQIRSTENAQSVKNVTYKDKKRAIRMKFPNLYQPVVGKETNKKESTKKTIDSMVSVTMRERQGLLLQWTSL